MFFLSICSAMVPIHFWFIFFWTSLKFFKHLCQEAIHGVTLFYFPVCWMWDVVVQWWAIWTPEKEALVQVLATSCFQTRCLHSIRRLQNVALLRKDTMSCTVNVLSTFCSFFRLWWLFKNCQKLRHVNLEGNKSVRGQVMCLLSN